MSVTLSPDQQKAKQALIGFIASPTKSVMVIEGYSGTGKSTLLSNFLDDIDNVHKAIKLINPNSKPYEVVVTATTNKAADTLCSIIKRPVKTIFSKLGLKMEYSPKKLCMVLAKRETADMIEDSLIFIDEASYVNESLLTFLYEGTRNCKIVFMGDPAQLVNGESKAPVFNKGYPTVKLTNVVRQADSNQIQEMSTMFRQAVSTLEFKPIIPNGTDIIYLDRDEFDQEVINDFTRPNWKQVDSRVLAWTNRKVNKYNQGITQLLKGTHEVMPGDVLISNKHTKGMGSQIKTDSLVTVQFVEKGTHQGCQGYWIKLLYHPLVRFFMPITRDEYNRVHQIALLKQDHSLLFEMENNWLDLRAAFASTINKSQGSTFDRVYIDLDDINRCSEPENIARLMYVAGSRARHQVYLTGTLS